MSHTHTHTGLIDPLCYRCWLNRKKNKCCDSRAVSWVFCFCFCFSKWKIFIKFFSIIIFLGLNSLCVFTPIAKKGDKNEIFFFRFFFIFIKCVIGNDVTMSNTIIVIQCSGINQTRSIGKKSISTTILWWWKNKFEFRLKKFFLDGCWLATWHSISITVM